MILRWENERSIKTNQSAGPVRNPMGLDHPSRHDSYRFSLFDRYKGSIPLPLIGTTLAGSIFVIVAYYRQYILRPGSITVKNEGVILHFHLRSDCLVHWDDIEVYSKPGPEWTKWGKGIGEGGIKISSTGKFYRVSYLISRAVIEGYTSAKGKSPYTWDGA